MATSVCSKEIAERSFGATLRRDAWWVEPLIYFVLLGAFVVYSTWAAMFGASHIAHGPYLSPMYSPLLILGGLPAFVTPAMLILWAPAGFRFTCYYYRKAYYRSFAAQPIACGVGKPWKSYSGERRLLLFQNLHRFFLYLALVFIFILGYDAVKAFTGWADAYEPITAGAAAGESHPHHPIGPTHFGAGIGSFVMLLNVILLGGYTLGCHSLRHLVGGCLDCPSRAPLGQARFRLWRGVTKLNEKHMWWAWFSLVWVGFTDLYIRLVSMGVISPEFDRLF